MNKSIPDNALCFFRDGNKWCCVHTDFVNLHESCAGFGDTFNEALGSLLADIVKDNQRKAKEALEEIRNKN